jgi:hypothetical protein
MLRKKLEEEFSTDLTAMKAGIRAEVGGERSATVVRPEPRPSRAPYYALRHVLPQIEAYLDAQATEAPGEGVSDAEPEPEKK